MSITLRNYDSPADYYRIRDFLAENYLPENQDGNFLQPTWDYMHSHPNLDETALNRIGIWEEGGKIVAVTHYEAQLGEAFFELRPGYSFLKPQMLEYAEKHLYIETDGGRRSLNAYVNDFDQELEALVKSGGYKVDDQNARPMSHFPISGSFRPAISLPDGFRIKTLAEENDLHKIHRVLWRGFNHPGEPPPEGLGWRVKMQSGPYFRKDLTLVVEAPDGNYAVFCGMWYEARNKIAFVEPLATDPAYRRMGLAKAAVLDGIRRCGELRANDAFVGSDQAFYLAIGFRKLFTSNSWVKNWQAE